MNRNTTVVSVIAAVVVCAIGWWLWHHERPARLVVEAGAPVAESSATPNALPPAFADREKREELRRKILEAWAKGEQGDEAAKDAKEGRFEPHPNQNGEGIDHQFVGKAIHEQLFPMLKDCYEEMLSRKPDAGGAMKVWFKIIADDDLGAIVEEDDEHDAGSLEDEKMQTCVRESVLTLTFPPPAHGGVVTVGVPIAFSPDDKVHQ